MNLSVQSVLKTTFAVTALALATNVAVAAGAVNPNGSGQGNSFWVDGNVISSAGGSIATNAFTTSVNGYASNAALGNAAWAHAGNKWFTFFLTESATTTVTVAAVNAGDMSPGFTVWRTDGEFDGGTGGTGEVPGIASGPQGVPHSFNQVGAIGTYGTYWMTDDSITTPAYGVDNKTVGNSANGALETMGYANSGPASGTTAWGAELQIGAYDGNGLVSGSIVPGESASLMLNDLAAGWYAVYVGGADGALGGSPMTMAVSSVPVPAAVWLFGTALVGLIGGARRKAQA